MVRQRGVCWGLPDVDAPGASGPAGLMKALADPTRLTMIASLWKAKAPICICDFTAGLCLSPPTISPPTSKLKEAGVGETPQRGSLGHSHPAAHPRAAPRPHPVQPISQLAVAGYSH